MRAGVTYYVAFCLTLSLPFCSNSEDSGESSTLEKKISPNPDAAGIINSSCKELGFTQLCPVPMTVGQRVDITMQQKEEVHWFQFNLDIAPTYQWFTYDHRVDGTLGNCAMDTIIKFYDSAGTLVATNDQCSTWPGGLAAVDPCSCMAQMVVTAGTFKMSVESDTPLTAGFYSLLFNTQ